MWNLLFRISSWSHVRRVEAEQRTRDAMETFFDPLYIMFAAWLFVGVVTMAIVLAMD